jgi:glycosyltransferase involved in cell wall biosynthesis
MPRTIFYVTASEITQETGLGRVGWHWREAFEQCGDRFVEIGPAQIGPVAHPALWPHAAVRAFRRRAERPDVLLVHEPLAGAFTRCGVPLVVFSHGIERRYWEMLRRRRFLEPEKIRWRTRLLFPLWRLRSCDSGLRGADGALLINREDAEFAESYYRLGPARFRVFRNGVYPAASTPGAPGGRACRVAFVGTWIRRKGIETLAAAARMLHDAGVKLEWTLAGTGSVPDGSVCDWPRELRDCTEIIPRFERAEETVILGRSDLFVLPSYFEGQPLALLQAMAGSRCCITSDCCGQRDLIQHRHNGLLHAPGDAASLAGLIRECAASEALRQRLGREATASVADRSWARVSEEVAASVHALVDAVRRPTRSGAQHVQTA